MTKDRWERNSVNTALFMLLWENAFLYLLSGLCLKLICVSTIFLCQNFIYLTCYQGHIRGEVRGLSPLKFFFSSTRKNVTKCIKTSFWYVHLPPPPREKFWIRPCLQNKFNCPSESIVTHLGEVWMAQFRLVIAIFWKRILSYQSGAQEFALVGTDTIKMTAKDKLWK